MSVKVLDLSHLSPSINLATNESAAENERDVLRIKRRSKVEMSVSRPWRTRKSADQKAREYKRKIKELEENA